MTDEKREGFLHTIGQVRRTCKVVNNAVVGAASVEAGNLQGNEGFRLTKPQAKSSIHAPLCVFRDDAGPELTKLKTDSRLVRIACHHLDAVCRVCIPKVLEFFGKFCKWPDSDARPAIFPLNVQAQRLQEFLLTRGHEARVDDCDSPIPRARCIHHLLGFAVADRKKPLPGVVFDLLGTISL
jgi:hypothetical protein